MITNLRRLLGANKGRYYYEIQIIWFVFMWLHNLDHKPNKNRGLWIGRFHVWYDTAWRYHGLGLRLCRAYTFIGTTAKILKNSVELFLIDQRIRYLNVRLFLVGFLPSLKAYLRLYRAGFRIHSSRSESTGEVLEINRFYWKGKIIQDMADIDRVGNHYNTVFQGQFKSLSKSKGYNWFNDGTKHDGIDF